MTTNDHEHTRRRVLRTGAAGLAATVGLGTLGTAAADPGDGTGNDSSDGTGTSFGRVYANDVLWRTNVVTVLEDAPDPNDDIYFLHDGSAPIVAVPDASGAQRSPFVSESAPGDRDWNGGQWVHYSARVTDVEAFTDDAPLTSTDEFVGDDPTESTTEYIEIERGRPGFGPPDFFVCPLNGRA